MNGRLWILNACLVAVFGCGDSHGGIADASGDAPVGKQDSGLDAGGSSGTQDAGTYDPDCKWTLENLYMCKACAADATCDAPSYTDNGDGTVTSSCCGLVWQQLMDVHNVYTWDEAKAYCAGLKLAGGSWRLPTIEELVSLVVLGQTPKSPTIDRTAFPNTLRPTAWSSSLFFDSADSVWCVDFYDGHWNNIFSGSTIDVLCVR